VEIHVHGITGISPSAVTMCRGAYRDFTAIVDPANSPCVPTWEVVPSNAGTLSVSGHSARFFLASDYDNDTAALSAYSGETIVSATIAVTNTMSIINQPVSRVACAGGSVTFSVAATGNPLTYQWRKDGLNLDDGGVYFGTKTATLSIRKDPNANSTVSEVCRTMLGTDHGTTFGTIIGGQTNSYLASGCMLVGGEGFDPDGYKSTNGCVTFDIPGSPGSGGHYQACPAGITNHSLVGNIPGVGGCIQLGKAGRFVAPASGTLYLRCNESTFNEVGGGSWDVCINPTLNPGCQGTYDVVITSDCGSMISEPATLTVVTPPSIMSQPVSQTRYAGQSASFLVVAASSGSLSYQWRKNGNNITGATSAMLTFGNVAPGDAAAYDVVVSNACGTQTSSTAPLTIVSDTDGDGLPDDVDPVPGTPDTSPPNFTVTYPAPEATIP
jgi:hypothetical protein